MNVDGAVLYQVYLEVVEVGVEGPVHLPYHRSPLSRRYVQTLTSLHLLSDLMATYNTVITCYVHY